MGVEHALQTFKAQGGGLRWIVSLCQRLPKIAVPTRTMVLPSAMAAAMSALMPIDKVTKPSPAYRPLKIQRS